MHTHGYLHRARIGLTGLRIASILFLILSAFGPTQVRQVYADKLVCGVPGKDGPVSISGIVNTYYPGTSDVDAGVGAIPVGSPSGAATPIAAGDLLLVIQMQGADINSTNTGAYGNGTAGNPATGYIAGSLIAGEYEYVVAAGPVAGGLVEITSGLVNSYSAQEYPVGAGSQGRRTFQVVRVPQYSSATIAGTVTSLAWNGSVGGVAAIDVAGTLNFNGNAIDVSEQGFRGGGGVRYTGDATPGLSATDYRTLSSIEVNASKGEGTAGTPRFVFNGTSISDEGLEGYPNGSFARGAPGNAGGGGTDGVPTTNEDNTGGGGGGNGGAGGEGGFGWRSVSPSGGFGGAAFPATAAQLVMGGGGGAGTINNNNPLLSSGGVGGGIVMVRAGTVTGSGTINADGADGQDQPLNDSGGGGGAGGSVLLVAQSALPAGLNVTADGGDGGDAWPGQANDSAYPSWRHGPGAGGGGGVVFLSSPAGTLSVDGGANGITTTANDSYGSNPGSDGITGTAVTPSSVTNGISGAECIPTPTVVKTTSTPIVTQTASGTTGEYTIVVSIPDNQGTALGFTISDILPTGFTYASTSAVTVSGGAVRVSTANPVAGTSTPSWGTFEIPGGGQVQITFIVNIAASVPAGVYQNPATAAYLDPTRTTPNGTTSSEYDSGSSTGEDIEVVTSALPDLTVTKQDDASGSVLPNGSFNWTITVGNGGAGGAAFTNGQTIMNDPLPGLASYYPQGAVTVTNGATPPTGTINCTIAGTTLSCVASGVVTLTSGASFSVTFAVTPTQGGELVNTAEVDPDGIVTETNEDNNESTSTVTVRGADLSIVKDDGQPSYTGSGVVTYTVTVTNLSGASITGATVSDPLPANVANWSWACTSETGGASGCSPAALSNADFTDTVNLPVGGTIVYTVTANIVANPTGNLVNTATVAVPNGYVDTNTGNNSSTDTDTLTVSTADLAITKTDSQTTYSAGGTVTYTVTVENLAGVGVTGAVVSDPIPANVASWSWACTSQNGGATGCNPAGSSSADFTDTVNLPVDSSIVYTVTAIIVANPTGDLVNTATVTPPAGVADSDTSNNSSTDTDTLLAADLSITKDDGVTSYLGGDTLVYTVTVVNLGSVAVNGATVTDPIPANIATWAWACTTQGGGATGCDPAASSSNAFSDTVNLPAGATIVYTVTAIADASPSGDLVNTAAVSLPGGFTDSNPANNTDTDTDVLGPAADLSLNKSVNNASPAVGTNITFTISVTNIGPDPATGVEVTENLPTGLTYISSVPAAGTTYDDVTGIWTIGDMAVNQTVLLRITVRVDLTGSLVNTAEITASDLIDPDSDPADDDPGEDDIDSSPVTSHTGPGPNPDPPRPGTAPVLGFLIPVTGFAPNKVTTLNTAAQPDYATTDLRIEIPSASVNLPIVGVNFKDGNWDVSWLHDQAGWLNGTAYPTWNGNSVLTAHSVNKDGRPGAFAKLKYLGVGEYVFVYSEGYRYTYKVVSNDLLQPTDASVLRHEDKSLLTLITCDTFDETTGAYLLRVAVRAALVDVTAIQ